MTASKIFLCFCLSFVGGIFLNSFFQISQILLLGFLILAIIIISVPPFSKRAGLVVFGLGLTFFVLGAFRHQAALTKIADSSLQNFIGQEVVLKGFILNEPELGEKSIKLTLTVQEIDDLKIREKVLIIIKRYPEYRYGDFLKISGRLEAPQEIEGFNYKNYLAKDGIYSTINFPETELLGQDRGNPIYKALFTFKNKFKTATASFIPPPEEGFLEALIFGDEENISKEWKEKLNITGTRHIAAVSGMNITIISLLLLNFILLLGFRRQRALFLSVFLLILYILMIGAPSSAVRAGIMGLIFIIGQYFGRTSKATRAVVFALALMLFLNPLLLKLDVGFQLSFLATLGMIYLYSAFSDFLKKIPGLKVLPLRTALSATLSAQVFTLPILIYNFGYIPLISPLVNILIVPFLAPITILIFIFGLSAILFWPLAYFLFWPAWLCLSYVVKVIDYFSKIPLTWQTFQNFPLLWLVIFYLVLGLITWRLEKRNKTPSFLR